MGTCAASQTGLSITLQALSYRSCPNRVVRRGLQRCLLPERVSFVESQNPGNRKRAASSDKGPSRRSNAAYLKCLAERIRLFKLNRTNTLSTVSMIGPPSV